LKKSLFIVAGLFLSAAGRAQDILPLREFSFESVSSATNTLLFNTWVKATVESHNPLLKNDSALWFDFDKLSQRLLVTVDKKTEFIFDRREYQSVTFHFGISTFTVEHVPAIDDKEVFFAMIKAIHGYSLYKSYHLSAWKQGYEETVDYYIVFPSANLTFLRLETPDQRQLDHAFELSGDRQRLDKYFELHNAEEKDEHFLKGLIEYLNG
jgi:hypothetical protein